MTQDNQKEDILTTDAPSHRSQQVTRAHNQALILAAAEEEFVLQSYRGATMQGIADRAGLPKANVHYYFKNKKNLKLCNMSGSYGLLSSSPFGR